MIFQKEIYMELIEEVSLLMNSVYSDQILDKINQLDERLNHPMKFHWPENPNNYASDAERNISMERSYRYLIIPSKPSWFDKNWVIPTVSSGLLSGEGSKLREWCAFDL